MPSIPKPAVLKAVKWLHGVALLKGKALAGSVTGKGFATYTEFCQALGLGNPHRNRYMDQLLLEVMSECERQGWPDFAALVIHEQSNGQREGPGDGWYEGHKLAAGDIPTWKRHRDDCWARASGVAAL